MHNVKDFCFIYGSKVSGGLLCIGLVFDEGDLENFTEVSIKARRDSNTSMILSEDLPPLIHLLRHNKKIKIYYKLFSEAEHAMKGSRACLLRFIEDMFERKLSRYILVSSADGVTGEMYVPGIIFKVSKECNDSPYLVAGYVIWTYYRRLLEEYKDTNKLNS